ncbi:MAG: hypothetical protein ACRD10_06395 [Terriglobia bacterium]
MQKLTVIALAALFCAVTARTGVAQVYGGGMGGGVPGQPQGGVYTPPKGGYKSSTGIAIGAAAAAGVGLAYFVMRSRGSLTGCVENASSGSQSIKSSGGKEYSVIDPNGVTLAPGDRVSLKGKKSKTASGADGFTVNKLVKDYGPCKE